MPGRFTPCLGEGTGAGRGLQESRPVAFSRMMTRLRKAAVGVAVYAAILSPLLLGLAVAVASWLRG